MKKNNNNIITWTWTCYDKIILLEITRFCNNSQQILCNIKKKIITLNYISLLLLCVKKSKWLIKYLCNENLNFFFIKMVKMKHVLTLFVLPSMWFIWDPKTKSFWRFVRLRNKFESFRQFPCQGLNAINNKNCKKLHFILTH